MDAALFASALALGLAGAPHCVAMCAAPCAAVTGGGGALMDLAASFAFFSASFWAALSAAAAAALMDGGLLPAGAPGRGRNARGIYTWGEPASAVVVSALGLMVGVLAT